MSVSFAGLRPKSQRLSAPTPVSATQTPDSTNTPWRIFFGDSNSDLAVHPYNEKNVSTWVLPAAYIGDCEYLGTTMRLMIASRDNALTQFILPLKYTDHLQVRFNRYEFDSGIAHITPERGTTRLLASRFMEGGGSLVRRGIGILLEHGFMNTDLGQQTFFFELMAMDATVNETHNLEIVSAILENGKYSIEYERAKGSYSNKTIDEIMEWELLTWDMFKREDYAFQKLDHTITTKMDLYRGVADTYIVDYRVMAYLTFAPREKEMWIGGEAGPKSIRDGVDNFLPVNGNRVYPLRGYDVGLDHGPHNALEQGCQIGDYSLNFCLRRGSDYKGYTSSDRTMLMFSQGDDQFKPIHLEELYRNSRRINPATGKFISLYDPVFQHRADFKPEEFEQDPFHFYKKDSDTLSPIEYFGNMFPGSDKNFADGHMTPHDYVDMAMSAINRMSNIGSYDDVCRKWQNVILVLEEIRKAEYNENAHAFANSVYEKWKSDGARLEKHPKIPLRGIPPKYDNDDVKPNSFGFLDLPTISKGTPQPWANKFVLPPFFSTMYGLRTISNAYRLNGGKVTETFGFDEEWFKRVDDAVIFIDAVVASLNQCAPGCVFKDTRYAPSRDHRPDAAGCLIENLVTGAQNPLFFVDKAQKGPKDVDPGASMIGHMITPKGKDLAKNWDAKIQRLLMDFGSGVSGLIRDIYTAPKIGPFANLDKNDGKKSGSESVDKSQEAKALVARINEISNKYTPKWDDLARQVKEVLEPSGNEDPLTEAAQKKLEAILKENVFLILRRNLIYTLLAVVLMPSRDYKRAYSTVAKVLESVPSNTDFDVDEFTKAAVELVFSPDNHGLFVKKGPSTDKKSLEKEFSNLKKGALQTLENVMDFITQAEGTEEYLEESAKPGITKLDEAFKNNTFVRTPLVYTPSQYYQIPKFFKTLGDKSTPVVWPSSATDQESPATLSEIEGYAPLIDPESEGFSGRRHVESNLPAALKLRGLVDPTVELTSVFDTVARLKMEKRGAPFRDRVDEYTRDVPRSGGKRKMTVKPYDPRKRPRTSSVAGDSDEIEITYNGNDNRASRARPVSEGVSEALDLEFEDNTSGNFERVFYAMQRFAENDFVRMISQVFIGTPANEESIMATIRYNIAHPFNYLVVRPHARIRAVTVVKIASRGETGHTYYGHPLFTLGDDPDTQIHHGSFTWYSKPLIENQKNVFRVDRVMTTGYDGGFDMKPYDLDTYSPHEEMYGDGSIFVIMLPRSMTDLPQAISLTGSFSHILGVKEDGEKLHYPTAVFYNKVWGWKKNIRPALDEGGYTPFSEERAPANLTCRAGPTKYKNHISGKFDYMRHGTSHWGSKITYPGCAAVRKGAMRLYNIQDLSHVSDV